MLILKIELGKIRLNDLAKRYGRNDRRVLKYSQKLDNLIAELMRRRMAG
ncbi:MAG: aspartyl-phosphate phosphatase Spo0E family protein [Bacillota bacterium]